LTNVRVRFRTLLVTAILSLLLVTVAIVAGTSFVSSRDTAENLASQVLAQTTLRVDEQVREELELAVAQGRLDGALFSRGDLNPLDREAVARYFVDAIRAQPRLSYLSWSLDQSGDHVEVQQDRDGALTVIELVRQDDGRLELRRRPVLRDGTPGPAVVERDRPENDPRPRPYYLAAKSAGAATWTETYGFFNRGRLGPPGITRAIPVRGEGGALLGVLSVDFDLFALSDFLRTLKLSEHGLAYVVELRADGAERVIAHPKPELLAARGNEPVSTRDIDDARVRALTARLDPRFAAETVEPLRFEVSGARYLGRYHALGEDQGLHWVVAVALPEDDVMAAVIRNRQTTIAIALVSTLVAVLIAVLLSTQISTAMRLLAVETEAIGQFHLAPKPIVESHVVEVRKLAVAIEDMKRGLRSFQKFVPVDVVRSLVESGSEAARGGKRAEITVHFSDITDFTTLSETMEPEQLVELLSEYLSAMTGEILASGGTIDKYIGDAIMAFWGAPRAAPDHAFLACATVLENQRALAALGKGWVARGLPALRAKIGLHTGSAVVGNIGSDARLDFTAIGDTVNLASRVEGLNKVYGTEIIITDATYRLVQGRVLARTLDRVAVKGKARGVTVHELLGLDDGYVDAAVRARADRHNRALEAYFAQRFDEAIELLEQATREVPTDKPAQITLARALALRSAPPGADWDGTHRMTSK
jgi:adenylate cyclase